MAQLKLFDDGCGGHDAELSQWFTPDWLAERLVSWKHSGMVEGRVFLEPSAGGGVIVNAMLKAGAEAVFAVEKDPIMVSVLKDRFKDSKKVVVVDNDFLNFSGVPIDFVVMNPPYEGEQLCDHLVHAVELCRYSVVALVPLPVLASSHRYAKLWSRFRLKSLAILVNRTKFEGPGDQTPQRDYCAIEIVKKPCNYPPCPEDVLVEWWPKDMG